jgi:ABC-type Na+ efflux pump permease subunit
MRVILDIALNELRILFKDRSIWINLVLIPIVLAVAVGYANGEGASGSSEGPRLPVDVLDNDNSALSQQFLADVRSANTRIVLCPMDNDEGNPCRLGDATLTPELAQQRLEDQTSLALLEIPAGFAETVSAGQASTITYRSNEAATAPSYILQAVQVATQKLGGAQAAVTIANDVSGDLSFLQFNDDADRAAFEESVREEAQTLWANEPITVNLVQAWRP